MGRTCLCGFFLLLTSACHAESVERQFFSGDIPTRMERLTTYPLEQQWRIFRYGNQVIHPPTTGLALPIAKQGKPALDYILKQLEQSQDDLDFRDSLVVFQTMQWGGFYDICGDEVAVVAITRNESKISHPDWHDVYSQMLGDLCNRATPPPSAE